jgi:ribose-phosphate pyrophosphokinase
VTTAVPAAERALAPAGHDRGGAWTLFGGTANRGLVTAVAEALGVAPGACTVDRFPDGEVEVRIDESVRGRDVFLLQPTAPPVNDHLMELLVMADACRRADAARITAIVPYFGYARSDKREGRRVPVTARAVADLLQSVGVARVVTVDAHTPQLEGFFRVAIDNLSAMPALCDAVGPRLTSGTVVVSPDLGGVKRATAYGERLGRPVAVCVKRRLDGTSVAVAQVIGDVRDRPCLIVDDMITTGGTIAESVRALRAAGARDPFTVAASHGVFVPGARERLRDAGVAEVFVSDSIARPGGGAPPLRVVSIAPLLAEVVRRLMESGSLHALH